ncbi:MAG: hypothetical protein ACJ76K_12965 [Solirubrobacteraceae bacterium]|jgi:hypothetical protein
MTPRVAGLALDDPRLTRVARRGAGFGYISCYAGSNAMALGDRLVLLSSPIV